jgi:hypothetical protein
MPDGEPVEGLFMLDYIYSRPDAMWTEMGVSTARSDAEVITHYTGRVSVELRGRRADHCQELELHRVLPLFLPGPVH